MEHLMLAMEAQGLQSDLLATLVLLNHFSLIFSVSLPIPETVISLHTEGII